MNDLDNGRTPDGGLTVATGPGPLYISGAPELVDGELNYTNLHGERIEVRGRVYSGPGGGTPVPGAKVEIWQADASGAYHPSASGDASRMTPGRLGLRGFVLTDATGSYRFTTIYPGSYPGRTRHIHVRVSAPGHAAVITQILVPSRPGDFTGPSEDPVVRSLPREYLVAFADQAGVPTAQFDFHLRPAWQGAEK